MPRPMGAALEYSQLRLVQWWDEAALDEQRKVEFVVLHVSHTAVDVVLTVI
jgi:hypothetical protein